ncbi:hypothetical protein D7S86_23055 [Pararobbsia silviterrae]|uniref:Uncharacterized protein n=1 Tax=Pararobbsia silviterrae TaxID=1792498 RepID=A0A494X8H8_9BURK|nr:hypothetical protein D7S86_23055 [Pararobbsia silviterrae]
MGVLHQGPVFRGDGRHYDEIFKLGFKIRKNYDSVSEINGIRMAFGGDADALGFDGRGISTSADYGAALGYAKKHKGYVYLIHADFEGFDLYGGAQYGNLVRQQLSWEKMHETMLRYLKHPGRHEINFARDIPGSMVVGAFDSDGTFIPNPDFTGKWS